MNLDRFATFIFDCDGVILDSNRVKTEAFRTAATPYGESAASALVMHHVLNGGISRYVKFAYFLEHIVPEYAPQYVPVNSAEALKSLLATYAQSVRTGLMTCAVAEGLDALRAATSSARWLIVSGGDQSELREIFAERQIAEFFDGGIFGSPDTKNSILARELVNGNICRPALFLGDSRYDHEAASTSGLDFVFVARWSEFPDWRNYAAFHRLTTVHTLTDLMTSKWAV